jgi:hypothetical protein
LCLRIKCCESTEGLSLRCAALRRLEVKARRPTACGPWRTIGAWGVRAPNPTQPNPR